MSSLFSKSLSLCTGFRASSFKRNTVIFSIVVFLGMLALALFAIDGYALYLSHFAEPAPVLPLRNTPQLSTQDIDGTLKLLDEREKKMRALFGEEIKLPSEGIEPPSRP